MGDDYSWRHATIDSKAAHDPKCRQRFDPYLPGPCPECEILATGRADEQEKIAVLREALEFYADPGTYHALMIWADPPCGEFIEDYSEDHGDPFYERAMPGKTARAALAEWGRDA